MFLCFYVTITGNVLESVNTLVLKIIFWKTKTFINKLSDYRSLVEGAKIENEKGITKPWTHLHPAPSTSTLLISVSTQLHPPTPSSFQSPALYILNVIKTKILHVIGQFPQI